jgi:hypothetical protein
MKGQTLHRDADRFVLSLSMSREKRRKAERDRAQGQWCKAKNKGVRDSVRNRLNRGGNARGRSHLMSSDCINVRQARLLERWVAPSASILFELR